MAVRQVAGFVQNDGNFCQLDLQDLDFGGPLMRIETFRCSQPAGQFGVTGAGTRVEWLAGGDHLTSESNRIFRHVFSVGEDSSPKVTLEIRETFTENGAWEVRTRDLDPKSDSYGHVLIASVRPDWDGYHRLRYELRKAPDVSKTLITSPLTNRITNLVPGLPDLGAPVAELGPIDPAFDANPLEGRLHWRSGAEASDQFFRAFAGNFQRPPLARWAENVRVYERMGDFRDKCIHPGTNLTGPNPQLASEYVLIRAYRSSLILISRVFDPDMAMGGMSLWESQMPLSIDPKPGVYSVFLSAFILGIGIYQLGIDKVHSDYGGVPMRLAPGSKLETGIMPLVDATRANQTLAELAVAFYVSPRVAQSLLTTAAD